ncbi:MAG TPA: hypothetical protein VK698_22620 [Kofleriaceae bacterium]|nr:hypothetical protein [Kofleriaceae bacterium]
MGREHLTIAGEHRRPVGAVGSIAVEGAVAFLGRDDLTAVDFSDPAAPRVVGRIATRAAPIDVVVQGGRAFVATDDGIEVIDVSRPDSLRRLGVVAAGTAYGMAADGERLLVSDREQVHAWTVPADPAGARRLGSCEVELAGRLTLRGDLLFVAADCEGMIVVDVARPDRPARIGLFEGPGDVTRVALAGDRALVADYTGGLTVVDVSNPRRPKSIGEWDEGMVGDVAVRADRVYLAMGDLVVVDIASPRRPREIGRHSLREGDTAWGLELADGVVCAVGGAGASFWRVED